MPSIEIEQEEVGQNISCHATINHVEQKGAFTTVQRIARRCMAG